MLANVDVVRRSEGPLQAGIYKVHNQGWTFACIFMEQQRGSPLSQDDCDEPTIFTLENGGKVSELTALQNFLRQTLTEADTGGSTSMLDSGHVHSRKQDILTTRDCQHDSHPE